MRHESEQNRGVARASRGKRLWPLMYVAGFLLALLIPILGLDLAGGQLSPTENRYLAKFPTLLDENGHLAAGVKDGFTTWLSDNIGLRPQFVKVAANIKLDVFGQALTDQVAIGRDGWYFYTPNHNIELATGRYVLSQEVLDHIAQKQQRVSDWYASQGVTYVLVLTAAKTSIYPEYIASGNYTIRDTLCDQLEAYLNEHTTVQVINTKPALLAGKDQGKLYLKTDTHWTHLGSYTVYQAIAEKLNSLGISTRDFDVSFGEESVVGEFSGMMGVADILGEEPMPSAVWDVSSTLVKSGEDYEALCALNGGDPWDYPAVLLENPDGANGTCLIYGDSQWMTSRNMPQWIAESFRKVVSIRTGARFGSVDCQLDSLVQPDVVIFGCSERYIDEVLLRPVGIPQVVDALPALPERAMISEQEYGQWMGKDGIWLDSGNGQLIAGIGPIPMQSGGGAVTINGWAADFTADAPFSALYLQVGDRVPKCDYGQERASVADHFGKESLRNTGFEVAFPRDYLLDGAVTELSFIGVSADGQALYQPVTCQLAY